MSTAPALPLPRFWPRVVHRGVLHALSLAASAMTRAWSRAGGERPRAERLQSELGLLAEELALKDARWASQPAHRRPHYDPVQRMRILELRAIRGWSVHQTAERFHVTEETVMSWMRTLGRRFRVEKKPTRRWSRSAHGSPCGDPNRPWRPSETRWTPTGGMTSRAPARACLIA